MISTRCFNSYEAFSLCKFTIFTILMLCITVCCDIRQRRQSWVRHNITAVYICCRKHTDFKLLNPPVPSLCSPNLSLLDKDPEACNTIYESSLNRCLKTCASHLIGADVSAASLDIPRCSKRELVLPYGPRSKRKLSAQSWLRRRAGIPNSESSSLTTKGVGLNPHTSLRGSHLRLSVGLPFGLSASARVAQLRKPGHFRYNWSILISELNLRKFQSTILPVHLHFGRCNWTRKKLGLVVWQKDWMQVDVEELCCQMQ